MNLRLPTTFAVIYGGFTLGLYVAIQGPTLMDLTDMLHVNNEYMSYSIAMSSFAYSIGGLLSGCLFGYLNRQLLIVAYFFIFGLSNIATPFMSNFMIFTVISAFKMVCAGGTDCAANVWILEMWPGKDAWLQALHFAFACGCALGPLIVEPFLSVDYKENEIDKIAGKSSGSTTISDQNNESRIHIPYAMSGLASIGAGLFILYLYFAQERHKKELAKLSLAQQQAAGAESIPLTSLQNPAALEANSLLGPISPINEEPEEEAEEACRQKEHVEETKKDNQLESIEVVSSNRHTPVSEAHQEEGQAQAAGSSNQETIAQQQPLLIMPNSSPSPTPSQQQQLQLQLQQQTNQVEHSPPRITSRYIQQREDQRMPYYVMFGVVLAATCLSFYCGIEITSMNYLATFAINIELNLSKSTAALMSSALTISFAVGRGIGIWVAVHMKPHKLFYLCATLMTFGNLLMLIFANTAEVLLWSSVCLFGIGCGPMFPAIVSFFDDRITKVTNTVSGVFILGSMANVAFNSIIIGHQIIDNALILIVCNLIGSAVLLLLFGTLHTLTLVKKNQRIRKFKLRRENERLRIEQEQQQEEQQPEQEGQPQLQPAQQQHEHERDEQVKEPPPPPPKAGNLSSSLVWG